MKIVIKSEEDVAAAIKWTIITASEIGFNQIKQHMIATAVSELTRNILIHAGKGTVDISITKKKDSNGIEIIAEDNGIGIEDIALALQDNYSTAKSLGIGLPGTKRLMDDFMIESVPGKGTKVTVQKWL